MLSVFKWVLIIGILAAAGWVAWKWYSVRGSTEDAFSLIPRDAIYCIATDQPIETWKQIADSRTWVHLQRNSYFASLTASANSLDSLIHQNDLLFDLIGSRSLVVSAHMTGVKEYDFLFLVDLQEVSGIKFLNEYLTDFATSGLTVRKEKYGDDNLIILHDPSNNSNLYISLPGSYLLASYTKKVLTAALDIHNNPSAVTDEPIFNGATDLNKDGTLRFYLNYSMLPKFMTCYSDGANEYVSLLSKTLRSSGLSMKVEEEQITAEGYTVINDSVESYIKTLAVSGKGGTDILEIAPVRTGFYIGFGFTSFQEFFKNFEQNLKQDITEFNRYRENLQQVEDYLKIDLQENFISWIGDEIALFELQSSGKGLDSETAVAIKAHNIEEARKGLGYIEKMVRRRTPVKFKTVDHHGYEISYLSMKGLFKVLFGKFFARYDKPYYTIINNYVVFSNHPQTLESIIDDYLSKNTLIKSADFRSFRKRFSDEGSVFVYLNTPVLFNTLKKLADVPTRSSMERNKEFIVCFKQIGFQLVPESGRFRTIFTEQFVEPASPVTQRPKEEIEEVDSLETILDETPPEELDTETDPMALPYIYVQDLNAPTSIEYFPDSSVHYKVELRNGFKDGNFTEYHQNGEVKMKGRFKSDKRDGTWRLYNERGKLIMRRNYEGDEVKKEKVKD